MQWHKFEFDIRAAYGSLDQPSWAFVERQMKAGLYDKLIQQLGEFGTVDETTDPNEDWSRCLFIGSDTQGLTLRLSLVGSYACAHRADGQFLSVSDLLSSAWGTRLAELLKADGIELVDGAKLRTNIELGGEDISLYEALFSSDGLIS